MSFYHHQVRAELWRWKNDLLKPPGLLERTSKKVQTRINNAIPDKVHQALTAAVKGIVRSVLIGIEFTPKSLPQVGLSLEERDRRARELLTKYQKIAAVEGAGTGAGGFVLGLVDFPALIAIKMKFLFELAHLYGHHTQDYRERLYLLYLFQLAFSSQEKRPALLQVVENWEAYAAKLPPYEEYLQHIDWDQFQREYRDSIDFRKMLQMLPLVGAVVGAWANYGLLDTLGETAINGFRMRELERDES